MENKDLGLSTCDKEPVWSVLCCQDDKKKIEPRGNSGSEAGVFL